MKRPPNYSHSQSIEALVESLQGYLEINMASEARKIAREILRHPSLNTDAFWEVIRAIGMGDAPRRWRPLVEEAYQSFSLKDQRRAGSSMLDYYSAIWDPEAALPFCSIRHLHLAGDLMFAMDVLLHFGKLTEAKAVARKCHKMSCLELSRFDASCLMDALATYYARCREWALALEIWARAPRDEPMARNAAVGVAEIFMAGALNAIAKELATVESLEKQARQALDVTLPGVDEAMLKDTKKDLLRLKRGLERLIPEKRRVALGL